MAGILIKLKKTHPRGLKKHTTGGFRGKTDEKNAKILSTNAKKKQKDGLGKKG